MVNWPVKTLWTEVVTPAGWSTSPEQRAALGKLLEIYNEPIRAFIAGYVRTRGQNPIHSADDLTNMFVQECLEGKRSFASVDRTLGTFRGWLKQVLRRFVIEQWKAASREQHRSVSSLDELADSGSGEPDEIIDREFVRIVMTKARSRHRAPYVERNAEDEYALIFGWLSDNRTSRPSMEELAVALERTVGAAKTCLTRFRDKFCELILEEVRQIVRNQEDLESEMKECFLPCWQRLERSNAPVRRGYPPEEDL
jgi:DNA-directed RNA polymerase specialized sigma24 family protein